MTLQAEEQAWLDAETERCAVCGHLSILHDGEYGYCYLPACQDRDCVKEQATRITGRAWDPTRLEVMRGARGA